MKRFEIVFLPSARDDLLQLYDYIADRSGLDVAGKYIDRIEAACYQLATFPERGAKRGDIRSGLRILGFERRIAIAFEVAGANVVIVRVLYGGRDLEGQFEKI